MGKRAVVAALVLFTAVAVVAPANAADTVDVVYLKNGSIIRGSIIEQIPGRSLKIETADGSVFVYQIDQVAKITKEPARAKARVAAEAPAGEVKPMSNVDILFNPLGFLQFGPMVDLEIQTSRGLFFVVDLRWHGLGLLSHLIEETDLSVASTAAGVGLRYFFQSPSTPHAPYVGFLTEFGINWFLDGNSDGYIAFVLNPGYRWRFGKTAINVGFVVGAGATVFNTYPNSYMTVIPVAMLELSFAFSL